MAVLDLERLARTPLVTDPFDYVVVEDFIPPEALAAAVADFPKVPRRGLYPPDLVDVTGGFRAVMAALTGEGFREAIEQKFGLSLADRPWMYTVRGHISARDGGIHNDSATKIITVLLYFNDKAWPHEGGRLRLLRNGTDLEDYAAEVAPAGGTLIVFRRSQASWHGHRPFAGPRKAIQLNWVTDQGVVDRESAKHAFSARIKQLIPFASS